MIHLRLRASLIALATLGTLGPSPAWAAAEEGVNDEEPIVVTARRREENQADVPATIAVLSAQSLEDRGVRTQSDLQTAVPGLVVRTIQHQNMLNFVIRGESLDAYSGSVPGVQPYVNEVPISPNNAASFFDIDSVQVLKGPQGTLFGRNSTGGSVLIGTAQPRPDFEGFVQASYERFDRRRFEGAINLPIADDKLMVRIAGIHTAGGAFIRNLYDGKRYGDGKENSIRLTALVKPTETISNTTTVSYSKFGGTNAPLFPSYVVPCGVPGPGNACKWDPSVPIFNQIINSPPGTYLPGYPNGYVFPGGLAALPAFLRSQGDYVVDACCDFTHKGSNRLFQNTTVLELSDAVTIKNIFGYSKTHSANSYATTQTPYPFLIPGGNRPGGSRFEDLRTRTLSNELQLQGKAADGKLDYIVGVFYVDDRIENNSPLTGISINAVANTAAVFNIRYHSVSTDKSLAGFAQATYAFTDKLNLTVGGRYTRDRLGIRQTPDSTLQGPPLSVTQKNPSWTVSLDYHFTPELMGYIVTRGSWRVGGYAPFVAPIGNRTTADVGGSYFVPEKSRDIEAGLKFDGRLGDMPVQFNVDVFNQWIINLQKSASVLLNGRNTSATATVPEAQITGVEGDFRVRLADWLRIGGSFAYQDARFTKDTATLYGLNVKFGPYPDVPKYSGSLFAEVEQNLGAAAGTMKFRVDAYGQSTQYYGSLGALTPESDLPGYVLVNARVDWADPLGAEGFTLSAFAKNIGNRLYFIGGNASAQGNGLNYEVFGQPRTYGAVLRYAF